MGLGFLRVAALIHFFHLKDAAEKVAMSQSPHRGNLSPCPILAPATNTGTSSG